MTNNKELLVILDKLGHVFTEKREWGIRDNYVSLLEILNRLLISEVTITV